MSCTSWIFHGTGAFMQPSMSHDSNQHFQVPGLLTAFLATPGPPEINDLPACWISNILDSCQQDGWLEYLVEWEGYGQEEQCWVPHQDIL